jgi:putative transposase
MIWSLIAQVVTLVLELLTLRYSVNKDKDLELLVLRQQLRILERRVGKPVRPSWVEKLLLALTVVHLKERAREGRNWFKDSILLVKPATVLKWHRELVKGKWTFQQRAKVGRPRIEAELEALIVRLANENPGVGFEQLQGELLKLGYDIGVSTVRA